MVERVVWKVSGREKGKTWKDINCKSVIDIVAVSMISAP